MNDTPLSDAPGPGAEPAAVGMTFGAPGQLAALAAIARIATSDLELRPMLQRITDALGERFGWELVALVRIERETDPPSGAGRFVCEAVSSRVSTVVVPGYSRPLGSGVVGRVAADGRSLEIDDAARDPDFVAAAEGIRSELCVPVRHAGEIVALLNLESARPAAFRGWTPFVEAVADQIAGAVASARHLEATRQRAAQLALLSEVSRRAVESDDLPGVLDGIAAAVREHLDLALVAIVVADEAGAEWAHRAFALRVAQPAPVRPSWPITAGVVGRAIRSGSIQVVRDVRTDPDYFAVDPAIQGEVCVPIRFGGQILGAFNFESDDSAIFSAGNLELMRMLADQVAGAIQLALLNSRLRQAHRDLEEVNRRLSEANRHLERATRVDPLTRVANRRQFDESLQLEWRRLARLRQPLSLLMVDVDEFKAFNDAYGHPRGDACLRAVAGTLASCFQRAGEVVARYGGEEFAVILPETSPSEAIGRAETVLERIRSLAVPHRTSAVASVLTVSLGIASRVPARHLPAHRLVEAADRALYAAKAAGRNRYAVAEEESE